MDFALAHNVFLTFCHPAPEGYILCTDTSPNLNPQVETTFSILPRGSEAKGAKEESQRPGPIRLSLRPVVCGCVCFGPLGTCLSAPAHPPLPKSHPNHPTQKHPSTIPFQSHFKLDFSHLSFVILIIPFYYCHHDNKLSAMTVPLEHPHHPETFSIIPDFYNFPSQQKGARSPFLRRSLIII